ncbi:hypothetical protein BGZ54_004575, partial [Gamsiella multidivaricata]
MKVQQISQLFDDSDKGTSISTPASFNPWRSLSRIKFSCIQLGAQDWKAVVETLDFTALERLDLSGTNFTSKLLQVLANRASQESNRATSFTIGLYLTNFHADIA